MGCTRAKAMDLGAITTLSPYVEVRINMLCTPWERGTRGPGCCVWGGRAFSYVNELGEERAATSAGQTSVGGDTTCALRLGAHQISSPAPSREVAA